jgi:SAM-dependent methyltransferase
MSRGDQRRWDKKWSEMAGESFDPNPLLLRFQYLLTGGDALDLACGRGQNAIWLAEHGYRVHGLDISGVGLDLGRTEAAKKGVSALIRFEQVDLDYWQFPLQAYDLVCVFRFLDRALFPVIRSSLREKGLLFYGTRHVGLLQEQPEAREDYLLELGELKAAFSDWQVVYYSEGDVRAELVARKAR